MAEQAEQSDFIVLESSLPGPASVSACHRFRGNPRFRGIPIIVVSAGGGESDRILGIEAGADDYLIKPFSPDELIARVRAVLRRTFPRDGVENLEMGEVVMNLITHKVTCNGRRMHLPPTVFKLLRLFMERQGEALTREQLLEAVANASPRCSRHGTPWPARH